MKMKKVYFVLFCITCILMLGSCGNKSGNSDETTDEKGTGVTQSGDQNSISISDTNYGNKYIPYNNSDASPVVLVVGGNNYIYFGEVEIIDKKNVLMLYIIDLKSGIQLPLCNKVDCDHKNSRCNGCICESEYNISLSHMQLYEDKLMLMYSEHDGYKTTEYVLGISLDGSTRYSYGEFETVSIREDGTSDNSFKQKIRIENGYMYYCETTNFSLDISENAPVENTYKLCRMKLTDGKVECLYEKHTERTQYAVENFNYEINDNEVYVKVYIKDSENEQSELKRINLTTLQIEDLEAKEEDGYCIINGNYYFGKNVVRNNSGKFLITVGKCTEEGEYSEYVLYDSVTGIKKEINTEELSDKGIEITDSLFLSKRNFIDENYIYLSGLGGTYIFDFEFNYLGKTEIIYASFGNYLLTTYTDDNMCQIFELISTEEVFAGKDKKYLVGTYNIEKSNFEPEIFVITE